MSFNNAVKNGWGRVVGFRCTLCGGVFDKMWGETCNGCRDRERQHQELIRALQQLGKS